MTNPLNLLTIDEAAKQLRICRTSFYRLIAQGDITPIRINGSVRVTQDHLWQYVDSLERRIA